MSGSGKQYRLRSLEVCFVATCLRRFDQMSYHNIGSNICEWNLEGEHRAGLYQMHYLISFNIKTFEPVSVSDEVLKTTVILAA